MCAYRLLSAGDRALTVELSTGIDPAITGRVQRLDARLSELAPAGLLEIVPTYRSLQIVYDPLVLPYQELAALVERAYLAARSADDASLPAARRLRVPVAYGAAFGIDLESAARALELSPAQLIELHSACEMTVAMVGFQPGFAYLSGLPERLHLSRHETPRLETPPGSVSIGGMQAAISSVAAPSAWHLLGRTPLRAFDLSRPDPFLFRPGDRVRFEAIDEQAFRSLEAGIRAGEEPVFAEESQDGF